VGHDRRGVTIYQRDADGAEIVFPEIKTTLRRRKGRQLPAAVQVPVQDKRVDDDLPRIGQAYQRFLKTGQVEE